VREEDESEVDDRREEEEEEKVQEMRVAMMLEQGFVVRDRNRIDRLSHEYRIVEDVCGRKCSSPTHRQQQAAS
jgi:hypothetical protein